MYWTGLQCSNRLLILAFFLGNAGQKFPVQTVLREFATVCAPELPMGWVDPRVGLGNLGWVEYDKSIFFDDYTTYN